MVMGTKDGEPIRGISTLDYLLYLERPLTKSEASQVLEGYAHVAQTRDHRVKLAWAAGMTITEIHKITGIARSTIYDILGLRKKSAPYAQMSYGVMQIMPLPETEDS